VEYCPPGEMVSYLDGDVPGWEFWGGIQTVIEDVAAEERGFSGRLENWKSHWPGEQKSWEWKWKTRRSCDRLASQYIDGFFSAAADGS